MRDGDIDADRLGAALDRQEIRELHARYGDIVTRRDWPELGEVFVADMPLELDLADGDPRHMTGPGEVGAFLDTAVSRFDFFEFVPLNTWIDLGSGGDPDAATARLWIREDRHTAPDGAGGGEWSSAFGLYRDTYRRVDGRWSVELRVSTGLSSGNRPRGAPRRRHGGTGSSRSRPPHRMPRHSWPARGPRPDRCSGWRPAESRQPGGRR